MRRLILFVLLLGMCVRIYAASFSWDIVCLLAIDPEQGNCDMAESSVQLKLDQAFGAKAAFSGRMRLLWRAPLSAEVVKNSGSGELLSQLRDAYIDVFDFLIRGLEFRVGKQRINFGKSDFFRHLDVVNPFDFSDPIFFDRRVPSWLFKWTFSIGFDTALDVFVGPGTEQGMYPQGKDGMNEQLPFYSSVLGGAFDLKADLKIPHAGVKTAVIGSRFSTKIGKWDVGFIWITRLSPIPMAQIVSAVTVGSNGIVSFNEKREQYLGMALAGEVFGLGFHGELLFRYHPGMITEIRTNGVLLTAVTAVDRGWDILWSVGVDYQCKNGGPFVNLEFSRGFLGEYSRAGVGINYYLVLSLEQKWDSDRWRIALSLGFEFDKLEKGVSWDDFCKTTAWFTGPELRMAVGNSMEFSLGVFYVNAPSGTTFAQSGFSKLIYLRGEAKF